MNSVNLIGRRCRICLDHEATTATPLSFRPCCESCRDKIQRELDKAGVTAKATRNVLLDVFGKDGTPSPRKIRQHNFRDCCHYHAGIRSDGGQDDG